MKKVNEIRFIKTRLGFKLRAVLFRPAKENFTFAWKSTWKCRVDSLRFGRISHQSLYAAIDFYADRLPYYDDPITKPLGLEAKRIVHFLQQILNREIAQREKGIGYGYDYEAKYFDSLPAG